MEYEFLIRLTIALAIGGLIGLERERARTEKLVVAGVRTFPLIAMSGAILAYFTIERGMPLLISLGLVIFGAFGLALFYIRHQLEMTGMTTPVAVFVTYLAGVLVGAGLIFEGFIVGIMTTVLLLTKHRLHRIASVLTEDEMLGAVEFITVAFILLPLTLEMKPIAISFHGETYPLIGRGELFDLTWILVIVLFVSFISFVSFIVMRHFGAIKGLEFSGFLGGFINSEATTNAISNIVSKRSDLQSVAMTSILFANFTMLIRNVVIGAFSDPSLALVEVMLVPCMLMAATNLIFARVKPTTRVTEKIELKSPFALRPAIEFAAVFALISVCAYLAQTGVAMHYSRGYAVYFTALGGLVSSAAVTASIGTLVLINKLDPVVGGIIVVVACIISSVNKLTIIRLSSKTLMQKFIRPIGACALVGILTLIFTVLVIFS